MLGQAGRRQLEKVDGSADKDLGDLSRWLDHKNGHRASYKVKLQKAVIRSLPSTKSKIKAILDRGDAVEGEVRDWWLLLHSTSISKQTAAGKNLAGGTNGGGAKNGDAAGNIGWMLIDGTPLGLNIGVVLERFVPEPVVQRTFGTALEVKCPEGHEKAGYALEVDSPGGEPFSVQWAGGKIMLVHGCQSGCTVRLRFTARGAGSGDNKDALGDWVSAETAEVREYEEGDMFGVDLLGNERGKCTQCQCPAYTAPDFVGLNFNPTDERCNRCGCNAVAHRMSRPESDEPKKAAVKGSPKKEKTPKKEEPLLIERAVALPKETMLARWCPFDVPPGQREWPRLEKSFKEVVAWSDLHADMHENMKHLLRLAPAPDTVLLLAGDMATKLETMESGLRLLKQKFGEVFYVPGNHELWVAKKDGISSVHKFLAILELCERLGVRTRPAFIGDGCAVCPLFSWYKDNLVDGFSRDKANIAFDIQTVWPWDITGCGDINDAQQPEIADFFAALNEPRIDSAPQDAVEALRKAAELTSKGSLDEKSHSRSGSKAAATNGSGAEKAQTTVISMSHFVPRQECYPGPRSMCGVMGCREIEGQVRQCGASCHVFGHSHIAVDRDLAGVRYVQHPLGYPNDYHRKCKPVRVWIQDSAENEGGQGNPSTPKPARNAREIALGGDAKWFVWNAVWHATNTAQSKRFQDAAREQYLKKAAEDSRRLEDHCEKAMAAGALSVDLLNRLRKQTEAGGQLAASCAREGREMKPMEVKALAPPGDTDAKRWNEMVRAVRFACMSVNRSELDACKLRRGNEHWEMTTANLGQCAYYNSSRSYQKQFETIWEQQVAPDPGEDWQGATDLPEATISQGLLKEFQDWIKDCPAKVIKRPPGRSRAEDGSAWDMSTGMFDRTKEIQLRIEMGLDGVSAGSTARPTHDLEVRIMNEEAPMQELTVTVSNELQVKQLKEAICQKVGRGPPSRIALSTVSAETVLDDDILLSSVEEDIEDGVWLTGINLGADQEVAIRIAHAASDDPQSMTISVKDTATILEIRKAIQAQLGEKSLSVCKLVKRLAGNFSSISNDETLNGRTELLFLGRSLPAEVASADAVEPASPLSASPPAAERFKPAPAQATVAAAAPASPARSKSPAKQAAAPAAAARDPEQVVAEAPAAVEAQDLHVTVHVAEGIELEVTSQRGVAIGRLKEQIAAQDITGTLSPDQFLLKLPSSEPLSDTFVITAARAELEICLP